MYSILWLNKSKLKTGLYYTFTLHMQMFRIILNPSKLLQFNCIILIY